jgi:hypothetical protein
LAIPARIGRGGKAEAGERMTTRLLLGALFVSLLTWAISWLVGRWADQEVAKQEDELARSNRFREMSPEAPRAAGLKQDRRRL